MNASAGYSGTPLWKKLGLKSGQRVFVRNAPENFDALLAGAPDDIARITRLRDCDVAIAFVISRGALDRMLGEAPDRIRPRGMLWIAWPKKAAKVATDVSEDVVRDCALPLGWVDVKVCAVDATWSGLKLVRRRS